MAYIEGIELTPKAKGAWVKYNNGFSLEPEHVTIERFDNLLVWVRMRYETIAVDPNDLKWDHSNGFDILKPGDKVRYLGKDYDTRHTVREVRIILSDEDYQAGNKPDGPWCTLGAVHENKQRYSLIAGFNYSMNAYKSKFTPEPLTEVKPSRNRILLLS